MEIINPVPADELAGWVAPMTTTFLAPPDPDHLADNERRWRERLEPARTWGVRDGRDWVATLATETRRLSVPGGTAVPVDALTGVTVAATHRRRGALTSMLTAALAAAKARGDALAYLVAAEWGIYGRFGYAPATRLAHHTLHTRRPGATVSTSAGSVVRQIDAERLAELAPVLAPRVLGQRAGDIDRLPQWWRGQLEERPRDGRLNLVVHECDGEPDGLVTWKPVRDFDLEGNYGAVEVPTLLARTTTAYRGLIAYLAGIDAVDEVYLRDRPVDE